jgi:hypothetical protein
MPERSAPQDASESSSSEVTDIFCPAVLEDFLIPTHAVSRGADLSRDVAFGHPVLESLGRAFG